jgi:hypothetical protein
MPTAPQVLIASRLIDAHDQRDACKVVHTPLELVHALETLSTVEMVILAAGFADVDIAAFLRAEYPALRLVTVKAPEPRLFDHAEAFALSA